MTKKQINFSICSALVAATASIVLYATTTYFTKKEAKEMKVSMERESVQTFQALQHSITQEDLEAMQDRKKLIEEVLEDEPNNTLFKFRKEELEIKIKRAREKLKETEP